MNEQTALLKTLNGQLGHVPTVLKTGLEQYIHSAWVFTIFTGILLGFCVIAFIWGMYEFVAALRYDRLTYDERVKTQRPIIVDDSIAFGFMLFCLIVTAIMTFIFCYNLSHVMAPIPSYIDSMLSSN